MRRVRLLAAVVVAVTGALAAAPAASDAAGFFETGVFSGFANATGAAVACPAGASMQVVGHPDDDLLFQSPDVLHDVQAGKCVRTVLITAGARGDTDLMLTREAGLKAAYANMAGVASSWTTADAGVSGHPMPLFTLSGKPTVSLVFMRLPEGFWGPGGTTGDETLKNLWQGSVSQIGADDGTSAYTKSSLTTTLAELMTAFQPDTLRTQDYVGTFGDGDHEDHHAAAYFARQAHLAYTSSHTFTGYQDYETQDRPQNVFGADLTAKTNAFYAYLQFDSAPCGSPPNCDHNDYGAWLRRQYVKATESGMDTTPPTVQAVTPGSGATNVSLGTSVSATFNEAIASSSVTTSSFVLRGEDGNAVAASVSANGSTATLQPIASLQPSRTYTATLLSGSSGITDLAGNALASDFTWSFTAVAADTTPPTVSTVTPANGAGNVGLGTSVRATFSEPIASSSVTSTSFVLRDGNGNAVNASVSASGSTATLEPNAGLQPSTPYTATLVSGSGGIKDASGNALASDFSWSFTSGAGPTCPCSIWSPSATPQTASMDDANALELGVRFQSEVAGYIRGIRFYKGSGNSGTHVGHLWTNTGTQLAAATFTNETATGWQQVSFSSPVAIAANTPYVASYFAPNGHFALDRPYFTTAHDNPPLHALANGSPAGANGVYHLGSGFPNSTYESSNYWVDVVFDTSHADTTPPTVSSVTPANGATSVNPGAAPTQPPPAGPAFAPSSVALARPALSELQLGSRCVRASRSGRMRLRMAMHMAKHGPVQVRIDRAVGIEAGQGCPSPNPGRRGRYRKVTTMRRVATRPAAAGRRRVTLKPRLTPGLYRLTVRAHLDGNRLSRPVRRYVRVLG